MAAKPDLSGRIAILGAGREGIAAFEYLRAKGLGSSLEIVTEGLSGHKMETDLQASGVLRVSPFYIAGLDEYDVLVRSPGVSLYRDSIQAALKSGARIVSPSTIWFADNPDANTIVITGTKGKSTTASLLAHMLESAGIKVQLAGNIGTPLLACDAKPVDWWVIELSSYQLADLEAQPSIGVLLNLASDHLDWHGSESRYHRDKLRLAQLVADGGLIANGADKKLVAALSGLKASWFDGAAKELAAIDMPATLPGRHNRANLAACLAVTRKLGLDDVAVLGRLAEFKGLPHRLSRVGTVGGVEFVDDSISTAPVATVAALEAFRDRKVVLLLGGYERGIDWIPYALDFARHPPSAIIALPDNGPRIVSTLEKAGLRPELGVHHAGTLQEAVVQASNLAPEGAVVLLSPGAPSFPHFRNYEDRGNQFAEFCAQLGERQ